MCLILTRGYNVLAPDTALKLIFVYLIQINEWSMTLGFVVDFDGYSSNIYKWLVMTKS